MAQPLNILLLGAVGDAVIEKIAAVDARIRVVDARGKFEVEYAQTWPAESVRRYVPQSLVAANTSTRAERDALLAEAEVICIRFPFPLDLRARTPRLKWLHQTPAGASNLRMCDIWGSDVVVTTSRGLNNSLPIAEYVLSTIFLFAKSLPQAFHDQTKQAFERRAYRPILVQGKTVGIIGLGGIGRAVARLAKAVGMRVVATRRSAATSQSQTQGIDQLLPPSELAVLLEQSDFVVVSSQWTPETDGLIGEAELRRMKPSAYLINVARGEIIDQSASGPHQGVAGRPDRWGWSGRLHWRIYRAATGGTLAIAECGHYPAYVRWNGCPAGQGPGVVLRESTALRQRPSPPECLGLGARLLKRGSGTDSPGNGPVHVE